MSSTIHAKAKIIFSMAAFGTISLFVKNIALTSKEVAFFRALIAFITLSFYLFFRHSSIQWPILKKYAPLILLSGASMGLNWILFFASYHYISVSVATLCYYFAPILATLSSVPIFHERMNRRQIFFFLVSTFGLILILNIGHDPANITGILLALSGAVFYATVILINKSLSQVNDIEKTWGQFIGAMLMLLPYILLTGGFHLEHVAAQTLTNLLILGIFHTGICYCLYFSSLKSLTSQQANIYSYIDPMTAVFVSAVILQETITKMQLLGIILIIGSALLNEWLAFPSARN